MRTSVARTFAVAGLFALAAAACTPPTAPAQTGPELGGRKTGGDSTAKQVLALMRFAPDSLVLQTDSTGSFTLTGQLKDGTVVPVQGASWVVLDPDLVQLDTVAKRIRALKPGTTTVVASKDGVTAMMGVRVEAPVPAVAVRVSPSGICLKAGLTWQLRLLEKVHEQIDTIPADSVRWASSDTAVATVDAGGLVTTKIGGHVQIRGTSTKAVSAGLTGSSDMTVDGTPTTKPLTCK